MGRREEWDRWRESWYKMTVGRNRWVEGYKKRMKGMVWGVHRVGDRRSWIAHRCICISNTTNVRIMSLDLELLYELAIRI